MCGYDHTNEKLIVLMKLLFSLLKLFVCLDNVFHMGKFEENSHTLLLCIFQKNKRKNEFIILKFKMVKS
jgi:hypothetical protein